MERQADAVTRVDSRSSELASGDSASPAQSAMEQAARLVFPPLMAFIREFAVKGGFFKGVRGLQSSFNAWALRFTAEAKRYEKLHADAPAVARQGRKSGPL